MALRVSGVLLVSATILAGPLATQARASAPPDDEGAFEDPAVDEAQRLFNEGANKFETADYAGAIELWTQAYGIVPNVPEYALIKAKLIANLASAQERAYAIDHETGHLEQAKILLESYRGAIDDIYTSALEREHELAWVAERLGKIDAELQAVAEAEAARRAAAEAEARLKAEAATETSEPARASGQGLVISGSVLTGLGVAGLGVMIGGLVIGGSNNDISDIPSNDLEARATRFSQGRLGNTLAIASGVGGAVLLGTGVALLVVGLGHKRAASREGARAVVVPTMTGFALVGQF
jgi:hypothetical protein